jgi:hypothetical protein
MELPFIIILVLIGLGAAAFILVVLFLKRQNKKESDVSLTGLSGLSIEMKQASELTPPAPLVPQETPPEHAAPTAGSKIQTVEPEPVVYEEYPVHEKTSPGIAAPAEPSEPQIDFKIETEDDLKEPMDIQDYGSIFEEEDLKPAEIDTRFTSEPELIFETGSTGEIIGKDKPSAFLDDENQGNDLITKGPSNILDTLTDEMDSSMDFSLEEDDDQSKPIDVFGDVKSDTMKPESIFFSPAAVAAPEAPSEQDIEMLLHAAAPKVAEIKKETPAPAPAPTPPPQPVQEAEPDPEEIKRHEKARRIARVIINDIRNYNPDKLAEGIRQGNILKTLGVEIERGRQLYIKRVPPDIAKITNYYRESLIKILADGRPELFGWK